MIECLCKLQPTVIEEDTNEVGLCQKPDRVAVALWLLIEADQSYIQSWHFKYDMFLLCGLIGKESKRDGVRLEKRKSKTERNSSKLHHAKHINISIWCLSPPPLLLTPLAPVAPHHWA